MHHGAIDSTRRILLHLSLIPDFGPAAVLKVLGGLYSLSWHSSSFIVRDAQGAPHYERNGRGDNLAVRGEELLCSVSNHTAMDYEATLENLVAARDQLNLDILYTYTAADCVERLGLTLRIAEMLVTGLADHTLLRTELALLEKHAINYMTFFDDDYPELLRHIYMPPVVLYYQGAPLDAGKKIALVGARRASGYAQQVVDALVPELVMHGWQTVSGGADGVDGMVHSRTLDAGGTTTVVLGSGLLQPYPEKNIPLFKRVLACGGTIISPFPLMRLPDKGTFPARNRIIAGLSQGSVVVQAAARSGALITARFALEQGHTVFAVPGPINDLLSVGCHALIRQGATLVRSVDDILEEFGEKPLEQKSIFVKEKTNKDVASKAGQLSISVQDEQELPGAPGAVLRNLAMPASLEDVANVTGISMLELQDVIFELHLDGKIKQHFNGLWERT